MWMASECSVLHDFSTINGRKSVSCHGALLLGCEGGGGRHSVHIFHISVNIQHVAGSSHLLFRSCITYIAQAIIGVSSNAQWHCRLHDPNSIERRIRRHSSWYNAVWLERGAEVGRACIDRSMRSIETTSNIQFRPGFIYALLIIRRS